MIELRDRSGLRRRVLGATFASCFALVRQCVGLVSPANAQDGLARIKREGVMRVANSGVYPPFESMEGASWSASISIFRTSLPSSWAFGPISRSSISRVSFRR